MNRQAVFNTHTNVSSIRGESVGDLKAFDVNGNPVVLDQSLVDTETARLQAESDSQEYARLRKAAYPSIEECVHAILDDDLVALQAKRADVKARFPK
jgi:hypothetical protein